MLYRRPGVVGFRSSSASRSWGESKVGEKSTRSGKRSHSPFGETCSGGGEQVEKMRAKLVETHCHLDFALRGVG